MTRIVHIIVCMIFFFGILEEVMGQFWKNVNLPTGYANNYWLDIFFLPGNTQLGWACGFNASVVRTTDGGNTWSGVKVNQFQNPMLESIHFVSPQIGFTSGPQGIWKSTDGGASWFSIAPPNTQGSLWGCYFKDQNLGLVVGGGCGGPQLYYRTTDGGINWTLFQGSEPQSGMCDLILDQASDTGYASSSGLIWQSTNAGQTWSVFSRANTINAWQEEISWLGDSFLVPWSGNACQGGGGGGGMCFTTNKGQSWNRVPTPDNMFGTFLTSATTGWACGYDRSVYYTSDAGKTWEYRNCGTTGSLDDITMFSDTSGWVVGEGIYKMVSGFHEVVPKNGLTFANTCVNSVKHDSIIIRNYSFESTIVSITVNGPAASDFIVPFTTFALGQCEERLVPITFRPTASGVRSATIGVSMINPLESFTIPLQGTASDITLSAGFRDTVDIGSRLVGTTSDSSFMIHNRSDAEITLTAINPMDLPPGHTFLWNNALPLRIPARDSALLRYRIIMNDTGITHQRFLLKFGMCDKTITMKSMGTSPKITSPDNMVILADCNPVKDSTFTITNTGNAMLVIHRLEISGGDSAAFSLGPHTLPMNIAPGAKKTISVLYRKGLPLDPIAMSKLLIHHSDTMTNRVSPRIVNILGKRGYTIALPTRDSLWAGIHCINDKGTCSATIDVNGSGSTQIHGIISKTGKSKVIAPTTFPFTINGQISTSIETRTVKPGRYTDTLLLISGPCKDTIPLIVEAQGITTIISFADSVLTAMVDQGIPSTLYADLFSIGTAFANVQRMTLRINQQIRLADPLPRPSIINPGKSGQVSFIITPSLTDTLLIDTLCIDVSKECPTSVCIPLRITVRQARLALSDTLLDMSLTCDDTSLVDTIMISNPGMLNDTLFSITESTVSSAYSFDLGRTLPAIIKPGDSIPLIIKFTPKQQGVYSYSLEIASSSGKNIGKNQIVNVRGTYTSPVISINRNVCDFGIHEPCSKDTTILVTILNSGLKAGDCSISTSSSSLILQDTILRIPENGTISLPILYRPSNRNIGSWSDSIIIKELTCDKRLTILCTGLIDTIKIASQPSTIAFGTMYRDDSVTIPITITNVSQFSVMVDSIIIDKQSSEFAITQSRSLPALLSVGDTLQLGIRAIALIEGTSPNDMLRIHAHRDCNSLKHIPISMNTPKEAYTAKLSTEDYTVEHGDTMTIYCQIQGDLSMARLRSLSYSVALDGSLFSILETFPKAMITKNDSMITWNIPADQIPLNGGIISRIHGKALVTQHRYAPITFTDIHPETNRAISIDTVNGSLSVSRTCANDLTGFKLTSLLVMKLRPPHPIPDRIAVSYASTMDEPTSGIISVYSLEGALLYTHELVGKNIEQQFTIPHVFAAGTYMLQMQSKHYVQREMILISP